MCARECVMCLAQVNDTLIIPINYFARLFQAYANARARVRAKHNYIDRPTDSHPEAEPTRMEEVLFDKHREMQWQRMAT